MPTLRYQKYSNDSDGLGESALSLCMASVSEECVREKRGEKCSDSGRGLGGF